MTELVLYVAVNIQHNFYDRYTSTTRGVVIVSFKGSYI